MPRLIEGPIFNDPAINPYYDPAFLDLNPDANQPDDVILAGGILSGFVGGLRALDGNDKVEGSAVGDVMNGNTGSDILLGVGGKDIILGGKDSDTISGGDDDDFLAGNLGSDFIDGGEGNDLVRGGKDADALLGGNGNDTLIGDIAFDIYRGDAGADMFVFRPDTLTNSQEADAVILDFDKVNDFIGLTGGVTLNDLLFDSQEIPVAFLQSSPLFQPAISSGLITGSQLDPDGNGMVIATAIIYNNGVLGAVLNATPDDIASRIVAYNS